MSAAAAVQAAAVAALRARPGFAVTGVYDGPPARAAFPYAAVSESGSGEWGATALEGREVSIAVLVWDEAGAATRLHALIAEGEAAIGGLSGEIDFGWRVAGTRFVRSRVVRDAERPWAGLVDFRVRVVRPG